jgi:hypothetical protein
MRPKLLAALLISFPLIATSTASAQLTSPKVGWTANLSTLAHDVSGSVTIVDEDTVRVDDFTYDGGGIVVKFYLGLSDAQPAFINGLPIGEDLFGTSYDGTQEAFTVDLPQGETVEGFNAISVWCVAAGANFGSGTFLPHSLTGDYSENGTVDAADYVAWRNNEGTVNLLSNDPIGGTIGQAQYDQWRANFGAALGTGNGSTGYPLGASAPPLSAAVPEPGTVILVLLAAGICVKRCRATALVS